MATIHEAEIDAALRAVRDAVIGQPDYGTFVAHHARYRSDVRRIVRHHRGGPILELGSVPCHLTLLLKQLGYPCIGVDLAPERCADRILSAGLDVRRCDIETEPLPFASASFELVLFSEVFEHLRIDPLFTLSEINRVLRAGGVLLLSTPNLYAAQRIGKFLLGRGFNDPLAEFMKLRLIGHMGHVREYTSAEMRRLLAFGGFAIESLRYDHYHYPASRRGRAARALFAVLPERFRSFQVIAAIKTDEGPGFAPLGRGAERRVE